jgi:uncharacterized protein
MDTPHLPRAVPIDGYGKGGFRFGGMSHRGSVLCLPSGIWGWDVRSPNEITEASLARALAEAKAVSLFLIGTGSDAWSMPEDLRWRFHENHMSIELALTGRAANTYNILLGEGRRVGAALIAVP